ncbi:MAG: hypothetical protein KC493_15355, partial [Bacteriovoracaceae bacterium]|nr:hypothetical protein [Bacteriovoracaceae bacterium]
FNCTADLHRGNGSIVRTFRSSGVNRGQACKTARQLCEREASRMRRRGRTAVYCTTEPRGGNRPGTLVTRSCSVEMVSPRFGVQQIFQGYATGTAGSGVRMKACYNAMDQCLVNIFRRQACRIKQ